MTGTSRTIHIPVRRLVTPAVVDPPHLTDMAVARPVTVVYSASLLLERAGRLSVGERRVGNSLDVSRSASRVRSGGDDLCPSSVMID